jgi:penicillin-binding protein 1C
MDEKFEPGKVPVEVCSLHSCRAESSDAGLEPVPAHPASSSRHPVSGIQLLQPTPGLQIAMDPRIPAELQAFAFRISKNIQPARVQWVLNGKLAGETGKDEHQFLWPLSRGEYIVQARVWRGGQTEPVETSQVAFMVK